jgi:pimeloyl-ACP methyl ester carboxylesterase
MTHSQTAENIQINTSIGSIAVYMKTVPGTIPIVFLQGVYYDNYLWNYKISRIQDRTVITVDMPMHGKSKGITKGDWTLDDCARMLLEVLDELNIEKAYAVGHSWGSMTVLRAAGKAPQRFEALGFCNMPINASTSRAKRQFKMQHLMLPFRKFYTGQVAKVMYGKQILKNDPALSEYLERTMSSMTNKEISQTDRSVIINADHAEHLIMDLKMPALALKGEEDYVPTSEHLDTILVPGGHVSPLEAPHEVYEFIQKLISLTIAA